MPPNPSIRHLAPPVARPARRRSAPANLPLHELTVKLALPREFPRAYLEFPDDFLFTRRFSHRDPPSATRPKKEPPQPKCLRGLRVSQMVDVGLEPTTSRM
jgi:hypothetical protein